MRRLLLAAYLLAPGLVRADQQVHGQLPSGTFQIDPNKVADWDSKTFSKGEVQFETKEFKDDRVSRWNHEYPAKHAAMKNLDRDYESNEVKLKKWDGAKEYSASSKQASFTDRKAPSKWKGSLNEEKWAKSVPAQAADIPGVPDFIVQVGTRPLDQQELQEKLNQYSKPPGERSSKSPPALPQRASKFLLESQR